MNKKKSFNNLRSKMSPEAQKVVAEKTKLLEKEMLLQEISAEFLETKQANVSRTERRKDM